MAKAKPNKVNNLIVILSHPLFWMPQKSKSCVHPIINSVITMAKIVSQSLLLHF